MLGKISKQPNGASLEASLYLSDIIKNICPKQANKPIKHIHSHCMVVGGSQTSGTKKDPMVSPTTPVNKRVKNGGSVE